ncbi:citrate lyase subunit beta [Paenibacillus sp. IHBB 10380]|nr:citrate lyase subunit beta [Paenibacillus sp. IHBB 10380]
MLAYAIGAALYCPATRQTIAEDILTQKNEGLTTMVIDLEDAIGDNQIDLAEESLLQQIFGISSFLKIGSLAYNNLPLLFIRVRSAEQMKRMIAKLEENITLITGFILPKFTPENGTAYFDVISGYNRAKSPSSPTLYGLPILETASVIYKELRMDTLLGIKRILDDNKEFVLNVRIGATDFSSLFGLRRSPDMTIYDIAPIRDCISDIINIFGRMDSPYVISGPVWEYFASRERVLKPQLRLTPFEEILGQPGRKLRMEFITNYVDGLIHEAMMDKENGIIGKTIIHPSHIKPVQSLYVVTHEEFVDATSIVANNNDYLGVLKSEYSNKMNEIKPHLNWAQRIIARSKIYGVLHEEQNYISLLSNHEHAYV